MLTVRHDSPKLASSTPGIPVQMLWGEFLSDRCFRAAVGSVPAGGRRDPFAPLLENSLAVMLRDPEGPGAAALAVPTDGAPRPVTRYADGRERINLGSGNYLGLAGDPRVTSAAAAALEQYGT